MKPAVLAAQSHLRAAFALDDGATALDNGVEIATEPADHVDVDAAFVRMRLRLQQQVRDLKEAHEQGLAVDMAIAAANLEGAAVALAASVRQHLTRRVHTENQVSAILYECHALRETIADLFDACLHTQRPVGSTRESQQLSPAEQYPWLRECLAYRAILVDSVLGIESTGGTTSPGGDSR